jgi:hypothetical protein
MDPDAIAPTIIAIISGIGLLVTSFRRRQDTTVEELQAKIRRQADEITEAEEERDQARTEADAERKKAKDAYAELHTVEELGVKYRRTIAQLRIALSDANISDPTVSVKANEERD